jgi:7-cyano-7-deazaguanine synthase in queuosine biosynthesis
MKHSTAAAHCSGTTLRSYTVVVNDCATPSRPAVQYLRLRPTEHGDKNFTYNYDQLVEGLPSTLNELQMDWLDIFGALFAADCICERGREFQWSRRIELYVPCRSPAYWRPFAASIQESFAQLTFDRIQIHFEHDTDPKPPPRQRRQPFDPADCVTLFSGGMDSYVGAALLQEEARRPMLVSHSLSPATRTAQSLLQVPLRDRGAIGSHATIVAQRIKTALGSEGSQRSRSLLFMAAACLVASALGLSDVFVNENGLMAVHVPMTEARIGSLSTRTASPAVLERFSRTATSALGFNINIENNLVGLSKADVVAEAIRLGEAHSLPHTVSCWSIGRTNRHCGECAPCLIRRVACEYHQVEDAPYSVDAFQTEPERASTRDNVVHLAMLANDLVTQSDFELELTYPELLNTGTAMTLQESVSLHRRWGSQVVSVFSKHPYTAGLVSA